jgi:TonB family protein
MSNTEPDERFLSEDELRALLDRWETPEPSRSLDRRVSSSFLREMSQPGALRNPILLSANDNEVVPMKLCSTCHDEFADKFSFCPVDGTPLSSVVARHDEPAITVSPENARAIFSAREPEPAFAEVASYAATSSALVMRDEFHLTIMDDSGLAWRLADELKGVAHEYELTWPEFKRDPSGFIKRSAMGYGQIVRRFFANRNVMIGMGGALLAMLALAGAITFLDRSDSKWTGRIGLTIFGVVAFSGLVAVFATWLGKERGAAVMGAQPSDSQSVAFAMVTAFVFIFAILGGLIFLEREDLKAHLAAVWPEDELIAEVFDIPVNQPTPEPGAAGMAKGSGGGSKKEKEKPGGGGGGGRQEQKPASFGKLPPADLKIPVVVALDPHPPPRPAHPALEVPPQIDADHTLFPDDPRKIPWGDPKSKSTDPSSGPGSGNGMGTGTGAGVGPGEGGGVGPGRGGNTGGGDRHEGGGGPGGGGGGAPDYNRVFNYKEVTQKARVLSKPEPQYTEDARKNQITGTVVLRVVFTSGGQVTNITAVRQLPYGLTEKAMAAARQIKFVPAMKDGHTVSMYMQLEYNFNLY